VAQAKETRVPSRLLRSACFLAVLLTAGAIQAARAADEPQAPKPFKLADGDRVVFLGSTFIERAQTHGYLEAALTARYHGADVRFRNLGWSGDNVFGEARAGFGTVEEGFAQLKEHVAATRPTLILLAYGANESFAGEAGLEGFLAGLDVLVKALDTTGARIVFLGPPPHEDMGRPLPDPAKHNAELKRYSAAIAKVAAARGDLFVDLLDLAGNKLSPPASVPLTDNGLHLTDYGYYRAAPLLEQLLGLKPRVWTVEVDATKSNIAARGTHVRDAKFSPNEIRLRVRDEQLPLVPPAAAPPEAAAVSPRVLRVFGLPPGEYALSIDGQEVARADARGWSVGVAIARGPEFEQAEKLRTTIVAKDELYFHRWRPQNITYLTGFRKHEQGNNAVEIPQFDPLVEAREVEIRELAVPVEHEYQLRKVEP
jgi:lysophospholipase L1-like esterase